MLGFINVIKPSGISSNLVLTKIKKKFNIKKIGHMGTLDPLASGVLPIAIGKATRLFDYFLEKEKTYIAEFEFGYETSTLDSEGDVISTSGKIPTVEEINSVLHYLIGDIEQMPPKFSAKKINGKNAYDLARRDCEFNLKPSLVHIFDIKILNQISNTKFTFEIKCGSGTYIRSIARDLGRILGSYATMTALCRIKSGLNDNFSISKGVDLDSLLTENDLSNYLISVDSVFNFGKFNLSKDQFDKVINGVKVKIDVPFIDNTFLIFNNDIIGIAEKNVNYIKIKTNLKDE